ncbi:type II secretion system minor pseudopilin GspK [Marinicella sediminis]|uniref:Type II secretion system protein K n=1 Tax=Marinicella sediminis TaxID=1792834 RepID=A0ABV7J8C1_9GAMM|nr:type II secretion system minor pseudopilin GspK [Marinicella sediminis]
MMMALVMLAIASGLAVMMWYDNQLNGARVNNLQQAYQARHYAQGMMLWASDLLREDYAQDQTPHDHNEDLWHQGIRGMVVEHAILSGELTGLNDRFNINNVFINGQVSEPHVAYLQRLLLILELDITLADKIVDWIDPDQIPRPGGAEDFIYLAKSPGYRTTGRYFQHTSELGLLEGVSESDYQLLSRHLVALPLNGSVSSKMNVNTMKPPLLKALSPLITNEVAVRLYQNGTARFTDMNAFFQHEAVRFVFFKTDSQQPIRLLADVKTTELEGQSTIRMGNSVYQMYALLRRNNSGAARVISRAVSPFDPLNLLE